jgi:hypothetical protein
LYNKEKATEVNPMKEYLDIHAKGYLAAAMCMTAAILLSGCGAKTESEIQTTEITSEESEIGMDTAVFTWQGVTVTLPDSWQGRVEMDEIENGFDIYQKASCDPETGMGFLCEISKVEEWENYGAGETLLAYTEDGDLYYFRQPTDFPVDESDSAVVEEYQTMIRDVDQVLESVSFDVENIHTDVREYAIPVSSFQELKKDQLDASGNWLWIARNEIYARHGRIFTNSYLNSYFSSKSWYEPVSDSIGDEDLSSLELENVRLIQAQEKNYEVEHPYPQRYESGNTVLTDLDGDGTKEKVTYELVQTDEWEYSAAIQIDGESFDLSDWYYAMNPLSVFYITDISQYDDRLEIAILDEGPSDDPETLFFQYDGQNIHYVGAVGGFPFKQENGGRYGFDGANLVMGTTRADLIETSYLDGYWWYDMTTNTITQQEGGLYDYQSYDPHELYLDLPVYITMDENAPTRILKKQECVYFLQSDLKEWILVEGKDGTRGYVHVADQIITNADLPEEEVFSSVGYFD